MCLVQNRPKTTKQRLYRRSIGLQNRPPPYPHFRFVHRTDKGRNPNSQSLYELPQKNMEIYRLNLEFELDSFYAKTTINTSAVFRGVLQVFII